MAAESTLGLLRVVLSSNSAEFSKDMGRASKSVDDFDKGAKNAGKSLASMASGFDGSKIANETNKVATAVGHVGEKASLATRGMQLLIGVLSVRAIMNAGRDVLDFTGKLTDLAGKTGITTEGLQRLNYVTSQSGLSLEQVAQGAVLLGRNLVGGNKSAVAAVEALGLKLRDLIEMGPERALLAIGEAIAKVPNPMERAALATALLGRSGAEYLPAFTADMSKLADQAQKSGAILSDDMVRAGDSAGDALGRLSNVGTALMAQVLIPLLPHIERLANWLGANLPPAIAKATSAIRELIAVGLAFDVWLAETAVSITETVAALPVLGKVFGQTTEDVAYFDKMAIEARKNLREFVTQGSEPTSTSLQRGIPIVTNYGEAMGRAGKAAKEHGEDLSIVSGLIDPLTQMMIEGTIVIDKWGAESREAALSMIELEVAVARANRSLIQIMPILENTFRADSMVPFKEAVRQTGAETRSFFQKLKDAFSEAGIGVGTLNQLFVAAFTGGGGMLGAIQAFATQGLSALMGMIPGIGPFLSQFSGLLIAGLSKLARKARDIISSIFGGPSRDELAGREIVGAFEDELAGLLTDQQKLEAGGEAWKETVIAIRDAYMAMGRTEEEALADAKRLWEASKRGADAAAKVIEEIRRKMNELTGQTHEIDVEVNYRAGDPGNRPFDPNDPDLHHTQPVDPGFAVGTAGRFGSFFKNFGAGMNTRLHGVEAVLRPQDALPFANSVLAGLTPSEVNRSTTSNTLTVLPVLMGGGMSARDIGRAAARYLAQSGLPNNESGVTDAIEAVVGNFRMSYPNAR